MLIEILTICSMIFMSPYYDCDTTWEIYMYDNSTIYWNGTEVNSYLITTIGDSNSTQIHLSANHTEDIWYGIPFLYFYMLSVVCQCDLNEEMERFLDMKELENI